MKNVMIAYLREDDLSGEMHEERCKYGLLTELGYCGTCKCSPEHKELVEKGLKCAIGGCKNQVRWQAISIPMQKRGKDLKKIYLCQDHIPQEE